MKTDGKIGGRVTAKLTKSAGTRVRTLRRKEPVEYVAPLVVREVHYGEDALEPVPPGAVVVELVSVDPGQLAPPKQESTVYNTVGDVGGLAPDAARPAVAAGALGTMDGPSASLAGAEQVSSLPATAPSPAVPADSLPASTARAGTFKPPCCVICHGTCASCSDGSTCPRCRDASFTAFRRSGPLATGTDLATVRVGADPVISGDCRPRRRARGRFSRRDAAADEVDVQVSWGREPSPAVELRGPPVELLTDAQAAARTAERMDYHAAFDRLRARCHDPQCTCTECLGDRQIVEASGPSIRLAKPRRRS